MITALKRSIGRKDNDEGFTLIELMVVVLIIAILLAIAIPTFLGARNKANARATQSNLRNALTAEQTYFTDNQAFADGGTNNTALKAVESNLTWVGTNLTANTTSSTVTNNPSNSVLALLGTNTAEVTLTGMAADNKCYSIDQVNNVGTASGAPPAGTYYAVTASSGTPATCTPPAAPTGASYANGPLTTYKASASGATAGSWYSAW